MATAPHKMVRVEKVSDYRGFPIQGETSIVRHFLYSGILELRSR